MMSTLRCTSSAASADTIELSLCRSILNDNVFSLHVTRVHADPAGMRRCGRTAEGTGTLKVPYPGYVFMKIPYEYSTKPSVPATIMDPSSPGDFFAIVCVLWADAEPESRNLIRGAFPAAAAPRL